MLINALSSTVNRLYGAGYDMSAGRASAATKSVSSFSADHQKSVTISDAGRRALAAEQVLATDPGGAGQAALPAGMALLQVPSWLADFAFQVAPSDPKFAQMYPQAAAAPQLRYEFGLKLFEHYGKAVQDAVGPAADLESLHQKLIVDKQSSEHIRQQFVAGIRQDAGMMAAMKQLGLTGMLSASDAHAATGLGERRQAHI